MTIFDWLNEITGAKRPWNEFTDDAKESFNPYMINRFISMKRDYVDVVNIAQRYVLPKGKLYEFYCGLLPKSKSFFRYVKSTKSINQEQVNALAKYYMCSTREVIDVLPLLEEQEIERTFNETQGYVATKKPKKTKNASSTKKNRQTKR
jgi:hypothetical protein